MICMLNHLVALATGRPALPPDLKDIHFITQQTEHFYGRGWKSLEDANALLGLIMAAVLALLAGLLGVIAPLWLNSHAEGRIRTDNETFQRNFAADVKTQNDLMRAEIERSRDEIQGLLIRTKAYTNGAIYFMLGKDSFEKAKARPTDGNAGPWTTQAGALLCYAAIQMAIAKEDGDCEQFASKLTEPQSGWLENLNPQQLKSVETMVTAHYNEHQGHITSQRAKQAIERLLHYLAQKSAQPPTSTATTPQ